MSKRPNGTIKNMLLTSPLKRLSRPSSPPAFRMTARDVAIIEHVSRYRFLTSTLIAELDGGSHAQVLRRLRNLWAAGFLDRPKHQHAYLANWTAEGNRPLAYALGRRGAKLLRERGIGANDKLDWTQKNSRVGALHLAHTIEAAEAMIAFATAAHSAGLRLIDHHELPLPETTRALKNPFHIRVTVSLPQRRAPLQIGVIPDRLFSIARGDTRRNYALELDRGGMAIKAKSLRKASFRSKLLGYFHLWKAGLHTEQWAMKSFRCLVITTSAKRIEHMIAAQNEITGGSATGLFLYSLPAEIAAHGALGPAWVNAKGDRVTLIDGDTQ